MIADPVNFLLSVATHAAGRAASQSPPASLGLGQTLFVNAAAAGVPAAHVVLRAFGGGNNPTNPQSTVNVQVAARAGDPVTAMQLCQAAFEAVALDDAGCELRMVTLPAWEFAAAGVAAAAGYAWMLVAAGTIGRPGQLGQDEQGLFLAVANCSLSFYRFNLN